MTDKELTLREKIEVLIKDLNFKDFITFFDELDVRDLNEVKKLIDQVISEKENS